MKIGDLVKLTSIVCDDYMNLRGIVLEIHPETATERLWKASVLWTDGDQTEEFLVDLEAVCK